MVYFFNRIQKSNNDIQLALCFIKKSLLNLSKTRLFFSSNAIYFFFTADNSSTFLSHLYMATHMAKKYYASISNTQIHHLDYSITDFIETNISSIFKIFLISSPLLYHYITVSDSINDILIILHHFRRTPFF